MFRQLLLLSCLLLFGGCSWPVRQMTDQMVADMVAHPFDLSPELTTEVRRSRSDAQKKDSPRSSSRSRETYKKASAPEVLRDLNCTASVESPNDRARRKLPLKDQNVQTVAWTEPQLGPSRREAIERGNLAQQKKLDLNIPPEIPGSEAPRIKIPVDRVAGERELERLYPELPAMPPRPKVLPGPGGKPYTLADLQRLAAAHSPTLRQAVSDVEAAKGNLIQAQTYPNPTAGYLVDPGNNNATANTNGGSIDQVIITGGKMKLGVAAAQKSLDNAILALKRARNDLSTAVRNAYFTMLVDVETLVLTEAQVRLADDIYRLQVGLQKGTQAAPYEPTALRAQASANRLAYKEAIASYIYDWKALVATIGLQQLPLSEIAGSVDRLIPYFDYDEILAHVLQNHTDILTAQNGVKIAQYNLKVQQVTPIFPNLDAHYQLQKDFSIAPFGTYQTAALSFPPPLWDQNKGNIIASQGALIRASDEAHRVQVTLTDGLATAYQGYRNNLYAMEYYRRYILPDLVRYYRGIYERRQIDPSSAFGDFVFAQQNLSTNITTYIGILGSLWSSVVSVADYLQTDDLFQLARPRELPEVPDLSRLPALWPCGHAAACGDPSGAGEPVMAAPPAGLLLAQPAGGAPAGPAGGGTGTQAPRGSEPAAPAAPAQGNEPPAGQPPAGPADAPQPSSPLGTGRVRILPPRAVG